MSPEVEKSGVNIETHFRNVTYLTGPINKWTHYIGTVPVFLLRNSKIC